MIKSRLQVKRGRYGSSKAKCFAIMREGQWYPARQLCITTGISYPSLGRALSRWDRFEYVVRRDILIGGRYEYQLTAKGKRWLHLAALYLPHYKVFGAELKAWQANLPGHGVRGWQHTQRVDTQECQQLGRCPRHVHRGLQGPSCGSPGQSGFYWIPPL